MPPDSRLVRRAPHRSWGSRHFIHRLLPARRRRVPPLPVAILLLFGFWVALSGEFDAFHLGLGGLAATGVALGSRRLFRLPPPPMPAEQFIPCVLRVHRFAAYAGWLVLQIFRSATSVARLVLHPRMPLRPRIVRIEDALPHDAARLTLAHSITLTPGTVTLDCDAEGMVIHAIDEPAAASLGTTGGDMAERVRGLFAAPRPVP